MGTRRTRRAAVIGAAWTAAWLLGAAPAGAAPTVNVAVDASIEHQTWHGFGATHMTLVYGGKGDVLSASQRQNAVDALFAQVKLTTGQAPTVFEAPKSSTLETFFAAGANDNADPTSLDPNGFFTGLGDTFKAKVVDIAGGPFDLYPDVKISTKWANKWLGQLEQSDYGAFLNECAEQALAGVQYWQATYGVTPPYAMLFNEPLSGNGELAGGDTQAVVDIVKHAGQRLEANGFSTKLVVPGEETEEKSLATATAIMNDPDARKYVGAIAYHPYPYGSVYSYVPNVLSTSGSGNPDASRIQVRSDLRSLGAKYGVPLWMTEVSHAYMEGDKVEATDFRILRGRAIHIHDELVYTDAAAFFGMNSLWDSVSQADHFGTNGSEMTIAEHDTLILVRQATDEVIITSTARAIGHYARFIRRGAKRIEATSSDPLLQVSAFRDDTQGGRLVLVAINNAKDSRTLEVNLSGATLGAALGGEQSTASGVWQALAAVSPSSSTTFSFDVPAESVTTIASEGSGGTGTGGASGSGGGGGTTGGAAGNAGTGGASAGAGGTKATGGGSSQSQTSGDDGGCSCHTSHRGHRWLALLVVALAMLGRRRFPVSAR